MIKEAIEQTVFKVREDMELSQVCRRGQEMALNLLKLRFEENFRRLDNLDYHNSAHTNLVVVNTLRILKTIQNFDPSLVGERDINLGLVAASWHDVVQEWEPMHLANPDVDFIMRRRFIGRNEQKSAVEGDVFMQGVNQYEAYHFGPEDQETVHQAILTTIPEFNPILATVVQPNLTSQSTIVARALALADIGTAGLMPANRSLSDALALFREEHLSFPRYLKDLDSLSGQTKNILKEKMLDFLSAQISFVEGRRLSMSEELEGLPNRVKKEIMSLFCNFDDSIYRASSTLKTALTAPLEQTAKIFGYNI